MTTTPFSSPSLPPAPPAPVGPRYFLMENGMRTGPHTLAVLRQKADIYSLTPDTLISPENDPAVLLPLRQFQVLCSELIPERPRYSMGSKTIERVNNASNPANLSVKDLLTGNNARERELENEVLKAAAVRFDRRRRDFLILSGSGNALAVAAWLFLSGGPLAGGAIFGLAVVYNVTLAWVLYGVLDRY